MVALPWILLAIGIVIVIIGLFLVYLAEFSGGSTYIDPSMDDDEIADRLERGNSLLPRLVLLAGFVCVLVSIVWRVILWAISRAA
jgi:hypothetical protein